MQISCPHLESGKRLPVKYTCQGQGLSPGLKIYSVPSQAQSLALTMIDPDSPSGSFVHWLLWNLDPTQDTIYEGRKPNEAVEGTNSGGSRGYYGAYPPEGVHRYIFTVYALDKSLSLPGGADRQELESALRGNNLDQAELVTFYGNNS